MIKIEYWDTLDIVYLTKDNEIAFVDSEKNYIIFFYFFYENIDLYLLNQEIYT